METNAPVCLVLISSLQLPPENHDGDRPRKHSPESSRNKVRPATKRSLWQAQLEPPAADHGHRALTADGHLGGVEDGSGAECCSEVTLGTDELNLPY